MQTLTNCTILTVDRQDRFYEDGRITVKDGRITAIGRADELPLLGETVDLGGGLVLPGLINTHTHSHSSLFRNQADDLQLMDWLKKAMWPMEKFLSPERAYAATALSCLEYLRCGITTYADQFYFADTIAKAAQHSGLRCFIYQSIPRDHRYLRGCGKICSELEGAGTGDPCLPLHWATRAIQRQCRLVPPGDRAVPGL